MSEEHGTAPTPLEAERGTEGAMEAQSARADAQSRLRSSLYRELHFVSCDLRDGVMTLRGRVSSYHLKQVAQILVRGVEGVGQVDNRLEVVAVRLPS